MFEEVLSQEAIGLLEKIAPMISDFYLAGGTGLALQLGHRISEDLDFFSETPFDAEEFKDSIGPDKVAYIRPQTLHCVKQGVRLSFLLYDIPLCYPAHKWREIRVAAWQDIVAEKVKTVSQRGSKKDFWDIYSVILMKSSIEEIGSLFLNRFMGAGINHYHVIKSMAYFEDAEKDPDPILVDRGERWKWESIKGFFEANIKEFESAFIR
jgi:hypothetical protein